MAFRIIPYKRKVKKAKRTVDGQKVLDRLQSFLDENSEEPAEFLYGFWEDQQTVIGYQELRQAAQQGFITKETFNLWQQDYSKMVANRMNTLWMDAIIGGSKGQPILDGTDFEINTQTPGVVQWINTRGAEFVTASTQEQKRAIASILSEGVRESHTVDEIAYLIRPCIGLTEGDAKATLKLYDHVKKTLKEEHPRMKNENVEKKAREAAQKYAEKKHRARAFTIAQTELEFAYSHGADQGIRQAQEQNLLGVMKKRWTTAGNENVCPNCNDLDGTEVDMDDEFKIKGRSLFPGMHRLPPAHPKCACAIQYIEVSPPVFTEES